MNEMMYVFSTYNQSLYSVIYDCLSLNIERFHIHLQ